METLNRNTEVKANEKAPFFIEPGTKLKSTGMLGRSGETIEFSVGSGGVVYLRPDQFDLID